MFFLVCAYTFKGSASFVINQFLVAIRRSTRVVVHRLRITQICLRFLLRHLFLFYLSLFLYSHM